MKFRRVCTTAAALVLVAGILFYLLPWLVTVPVVLLFVTADAWHEGHSVFVRSLGFGLIVSAFLVWGMRGLAGSVRQFGLSAGLSIACVLVAGGLAYTVLTGAAAAQIEQWGMQAQVSQVADGADAGRLDRQAPQVQAGPSATTRLALGISEWLVWFVAGLMGLIGIVFGVSIMPDEKPRRHRR
ncbi:MAG: hypothetical protein AB8C46_16690 [Burkholderiaceae bacterium]